MQFVTNTCELMRSMKFLKQIQKALESENREKEKTYSVLLKINYL